MKYKPALLAITLGCALLSAKVTHAAAAFSSSPVLTLQAATSKDGGKAKKPKKSKAKKGGGVTFHDGSAESRSERDRRLMRECRGRSNSGVCEGYTRP